MLALVLALAGPGIPACDGGPEPAHAADRTPNPDRVDSPAAVARSDDAPPGTPPGAQPFPPELRRRIDEAVSARGPGYAPRTRHLHEDGSARFTNRLALESSPYLLQHAHNPVNWYPWGDEAFAVAAEQGRPVLLSIGYSTCHWCHVMEEESFEDLEIATYLNEHYVCVKVDREERPDVDAIYMAAVQALTRRGGWPMTTWLTPDREPFYGGTYFPARDGDRGSRIGFLTLVRKMREIYDSQPDDVRTQAAQLANAIRANLGGQDPLATPVRAEASVLDRVDAHYRRTFDPEHGGMNRAPKFPSSLSIRFLLRQHRRTGAPEPLDMATLTLDRMAAGGMYDHAGGGFHRYATDRRWLVPHFEKMLYDNGLLAVAYLEAYQATGRAEYARIVREILRYLERDMTSPEGAFYSATDADSLNPAGHREEGWFFTWTPDEVSSTLPADDAAAVLAALDVTPGGNFEGRSILNTPRPLDAVASDLDLAPAELRTRLDRAREALYEARKERPPPIRDEKILAAWNGLAISAAARAGLALGEPRYTEMGRRAARFVLDHMRVEGRLRRSYKDGRARFEAYLDDYAFLIAALLDLYETTGELPWLEEAIALDAVLHEHYEDGERGGFYMTADDAEKLLVREKPSYDGAVPSGTSVAVLDLLRLHGFTGEESYLARAEAALASVGAILDQQPTALSELLLAIDFLVDTPKEVVIVTPGSRDGAAPLLEVLGSTFLPNRNLVITTAAELEAHGARVPFARHRAVQGGRPTAYVCENQVCDFPTSDPAVFAEQLAKRSN